MTRVNTTRLTQENDLNVASTTYMLTYIILIHYLKEDYFPKLIAPSTKRSFGSGEEIVSNV